MINKILVVGGSGFVGSHTADALSENGYDVTIFDSTPSQWLRDNQKMIVGDILDKEALNKALVDMNCVFHFAAIADINKAKSNPSDTINVNIIGTSNLMQASIEAGIERFVFASTIYVYSPHGSFYRATKQASEILIEEYCKSYSSIEYTFLRYGSLYGPRAQSWNGLHRYVEEIIRDEKINYFGDGEERREYIHVVDAAQLSVEALDNDYIGRAITVTGQQVVTSKELMNMIFEIAGIEREIKYSDRSNNEDHYSLTPYRDISRKAKKITPKEWIDIGEGILEVIKEIRSR